MKKLTHILLLISLVGLMGASWPFSWIFPSPPNREAFGSHSWIDKQIKIIQSEARNISPTVLKLSVLAYVNAKKRGLAQKDTLTIIDYSKHSIEKRLWVVDMKKNKILFNTWVSHGKNSGGATATSFSNKLGSLKSSLGLFVTDQPYIGGNGYSLRLKGLERGVNDNAYRRNVVIHGAWYVSPEMAKQRGQLGRSWGCPAVPQNTIRPLVDTIKQKSLVFVYYPDQNWIKNSTFLMT